MGYMSLRSVFFLSLLVLPATAFAATGDWVDGDHVRLRLVAARAAPDGPLDAAIEIELEPGWKTYWRSPGDAGIPPRLDFSASANASGPTIDFPPPERADDGFAVSNVYHDRVVLPVRFATSSASTDTRIELKADLGVCDEVCVPVSLSAGVTVPAGEADAAAAGEIAEARAAVPGPGRPGQFEVLSLKRVGGTDAEPQFEATVAVGDAKSSLLFAETPADWYPSPPALLKAETGKAVYTFAADRKTATSAIAGAEIRLTLTDGGEATSRVFTLDAASTSP